MELQVERDTMGWIEHEAVLAMTMDEMKRLVVGLSVALVYMEEEAEKYPILGELIDHLLEEHR